MHENSIQEHNGKKTNIKVHEGFNVVWEIMPTSTNERESFTILRT